MKILIADDDRISRKLMERTLQRSGYQVVTVADGLHAAEELAKADGPRLALVDWMMPKLDGLTLCRELRKRRDQHYVYVVLLTAKELHEDIVTGLLAGADDYLTKPCHPAELKARLHTGERILQLESKLVEAREEMRFKATHDALTSLWDRGAILNLLTNALKRSDFEGFPVSILLCDIDHFKQINDTYGHMTGDEVLRETACRLGGSVRTTDSVGRYGGEEFLIVLSGCSAENLTHLAEYMRKTIGNVPFSTSGGSLTVTLSIGALTIDKWDGSLSLEHILNDVDAALYRAKGSGRNCVKFGGAPGPVLDQNPKQSSLEAINPRPTYSLVKCSS